MSKVDSLIKYLIIYLDSKIPLVLLADPLLWIKIKVSEVGDLTDFDVINNVICSHGHMGVA